MAYPIEIKDVFKSYGRTKVLQDLSIKVEKGSIYAFLGENGEGKTTTIRLMLDMLKADNGSVKVLGETPSEKNRETLLQRVGYVPEMPYFYEWMRIDEILRFTSSFYKNWDKKREEELIKFMGLDPAKKIGELSFGGKVKVSLVIALSHKPELLLLDDPTSGLDAAIRRDFLESIIESAEMQGVTIFFSSHIITELERVADWVGLLKNGKLLFEKPLEVIKAEVKKLFVICSDELGEKENCLDVIKDKIVCKNKHGRNLEVVVQGYDDKLPSLIASEKIEKINVEDLDLEEIFVAYSRQKSKIGVI